MSKIILKNAVQRKRNWLYYIDFEGNLCGYDMLKRRNKLDKLDKIKNMRKDKYKLARKIKECCGTRLDLCIRCFDNHHSILDLDGEIEKLKEGVS